MTPPHIELDIVYHVHGQEYGLSTTPDGRIEMAARWIVQHFGLAKLYASIAIVDDETIRQLNAERLGHDWPTDVISFVLDQNGASLEGEVIASAETAAKLCQAAGWSARDELLLYVVHGLLHVAGQDDVEQQDRQDMRRAERECLMAVGVWQADQHGQRWDDIALSEVDG